MATLTLAALNRKADNIYGADGRYRLLIVRRCRHAGEALVPGQLRLVEHLREAAELVRRGDARPADAVTRTDVEMFMLLRRAMAPGGGSISTAPRAGTERAAFLR